jgi:hypothetical protein
MPMTEANEEKKSYPRGVFGFLARLRDSGALALMPPSWVKVMIALYSHRDAQGFAWPSQRLLSQEAGVDRRTVRKFLKWAKACLGIRVSRKKCNSYYLPLEEKVEAWFPSGFVPKRAAQHPKELKAENGKKEALR